MKTSIIYNYNVVEGITSRIPRVLLLYYFLNILRTAWSVLHDVYR